MAHLILSSADFLGWERIVTDDFRSEVLDEYANSFYKQYFREILGDETFILVDEVDRPKWVDLLNGVARYDTLDGGIAKYDGLKKSFLRFIYFEFVRDNFNSLPVGKVRQNSENSESNSPSEVIGIARSRYNAAVYSLNSSLCKFLESFDEVVIVINSFSDDGGGLYTINVSSTKYLLDGDKISYMLDEYVISGLVENVSFVVDLGEVGLDVSGNVSWSPFESIDLKIPEIVGI